MTHDDYRDALAWHALGGLPAPELAAHLDTCSPCTAELDRLRDTAAHLALTAPPLEPSPAHLARVLDAIEAPALPRIVVRPIAAPARRPATRQPFGRVLGVAAACVVAVLVVTQVGLLRELAAARRQIAVMRATGAFLSSPDVAIVALAGRHAHATLAFQRSTGRYVFLSDDLDPPPPGSRYQLWVVADGVEPADVVVAASAHGRLATPPRGDAPFLFGVSLEPEDGSDEPTGAMLLLSPVVRTAG